MGALLPGAPREAEGEERAPEESGMKQLAFEPLAPPLTVREYVLTKLRDFKLRQRARDARRDKARRTRIAWEKRDRPCPSLGKTTNLLRKQTLSVSPDVL